MKSGTPARLSIVLAVWSFFILLAIGGIQFAARAKLVSSIELWSPLWIGCVTLLNWLGFFLVLRLSTRTLNYRGTIARPQRELLHAVRQAVLIVDERRCVTFINDACEEEFGWSLDEVDGKLIESLPWKPADEHTNTSQLAAFLLSADAKPVSLFVSQSIRTYVPHSTPLVEKPGRILGTLILLVDVTEQTEQAAELREARAELHDKRNLVDEQQRRLHYYNHHDDLTKCLNRRAFFERFFEAWRSAQRYGHSISCLIVDTDYLHSINDNYGSIQGDAVLEAVARILLDSVRETDPVCRYTGEKFCVVLPHINAESAARAAERFRQAVASLRLPSLKVTVSIGCSTTEFGAESVEELLEEAERALFLAKQQGRNRIQVFPGESRAATLPGDHSEESGNVGQESQALAEVRSMQRELTERPSEARKP